MDEFFATLESIIKRIFDLIASIFKIFETPNEENGQESSESAEA